MPLVASHHISFPCCVRTCGEITRVGFLFHAIHMRPEVLGMRLILCDGQKWMDMEVWMHIDMF